MIAKFPTAADTLITEPAPAARDDQFLIAYDYARPMDPALQ
jgi:hypothetical protein